VPPPRAVAAVGTVADAGAIETWLCDELAERLGLARGDMRRYLGEECCYELEPALHAASLARFEQQAAALGHARAGLAPEPLTGYSDSR
jgi:hypothetical protein